MEINNYAGHKVAPIRRSRNGSYMPVGDTLKFGERCAFNSTKHSATGMLISDCTEKQNLFNAVWDRRKLGRNWQEVLCHVVLLVRLAEKEVPVGVSAFAMMR